MNSITIAPATHVIITYSKIHYFITQEEHDRLQDLGFDQAIVVNGNTIMGRNISDVMTTQKYYETFPDKVPDTIRYPRDDKYQSLPERTSSKNGLASLIRGIKSYVDESTSRGEKPVNAQAIMDRMVKKYNHLYRK